MLPDMKTLRERLFNNDVIFADRILLTALIKGNSKIRQQILKEVEPKDFSRYKLIFSGIIESLQATGEVSTDYLFQKAVNYVHTRVVASEHEFIDRIYALPMPPSDLLEKVIGCMKIPDPIDWDDPDFDFDSLPPIERCVPSEWIHEEWVTMAALVHGDEAIRQRIFNEITVDDFDLTDLDSVFEWALELWQEKTTIQREDLYKRGERYAIEELMSGYTAPIKQVLAIDMPDAEMIDKAIEHVKRLRSV